MQLKLYRHLWGITLPWEQSFAKIKQASYAGIEAILPPADQADRFRELLQQYQLDYVSVLFTSGATVQEHVQSFRRELNAAEVLGVKQVTFHSGHDAFSEAEAKSFFSEAIAIQKSTSVRIGHETHRHRILYNPWITRTLLNRFDDLNLVCDYSHWVCVAERLLPDCDAILQQAADHCIHVHARVGYEEGPQVPDPSASEYRPALEAHEKWWRMIWNAHVKEKLTATTMTPEFGPPGYLHTLPHTNVPVADLWTVCEWMTGRLRTTFAEHQSAGGHG